MTIRLFFTFLVVISIIVGLDAVLSWFFHDMNPEHWNPIVLHVAQAIGAMSIMGVLYALEE